MSCADSFVAYACEHCKALIFTRCPTCHAEVAHGAIPQVNVHFAGNPHPPMTRSQIEDEI